MADSNNQLKIRKMVPEDFPQVLELLYQLADHHDTINYLDVTPENLYQEWFEENGFLQYIGFVAVEENSKILGYALIYSKWSSTRARGAILENFCIAKDQRRRGIGGMLLNHLIRYCQEHGWGFLDLIASLQNESAVKFYEKYGAVLKTGWTTVRFYAESLRRLSETFQEKSLGSKISVRPMTAADCQRVWELIKDFCQESNIKEVKTTAESLARDGFQDKGMYIGFVATVEEKDQAGEKIVGHALIEPKWSSFKGRGFVLDNLYVIPTHRRQCVASLLLSAVAAYCLDRGGLIIDLLVDSDNQPAIDFYTKHGASIMDGWGAMRFLTHNL